MQQFRPKTAHAPAELLSIQYLRGIAALTVLVSHTLQWPLPQMSEGLLRSGRLGVEIFFVISGFIITMVGGDGAFDRGNFLWRRTLRVVPLYWGATIVVAVMALLLPAFFRTTVPTVTGFVDSLLFIPSEMPKAPLLGVGWTLDYEVFFYVLFALLAGFRSEMRTLLLCTMLLVLVTVGQLSPHASALQYFYTSPSLIGFAVGTCLAQAYRHGLLSRLSHLPAWLPLSVAGLLLAVFYIVPATEVEERAPIYFHIIMSATAVSIVGSALLLEQARRLRPVAALHYLGDASYSIYLFHLFIVAAGWAIARRLLPVEPMAIYFAISAVTGLAALAGGLAAHHLFERPVLEFFKRRRVKARISTALAPAAA